VSTIGFAFLLFPVAAQRLLAAEGAQGRKPLEAGYQAPDGLSLSAFTHEGGANADDRDPHGRDRTGADAGGRGLSRQRRRLRA